MPFPNTAGLVGFVQVESSPALVADVLAAPVAAPIGGLPAKTVVALPNAATAPINTSGSQILTSVAVASNPFGHQDPLDPMNLWALFRYFWAFDIKQSAGAPQLRLHDRTKRVRHHHRTAMSEYLGLGVALLVANRWLSQQYPGQAIRAVDAEAALADPTLIAGIAGVGNLRPDCILLVENGPLVLLECKGSQTRARRAQTLARATRQLMSTSHNGAIPQGIAVHTTANIGGIVVAAIDPEGDDAWSAAPSDDRDPQIELTATRANVGDVSAFRAQLEQLADASLLAWIGEEESALAALPARLRPLTRGRLVNNSQQRVETALGRQFVGVESRLDVGSEVFYLFRGVEASVREMLGDRRRRNADATTDRQTSEFARQVPGIVDGDELWGFTTDGAAVRLRRG